MQRGRNLLGNECRLIDGGGAPEAQASALSAAVADADAVVNLAGENVLKGRWTGRRKAALLSSRVDTTRAIVEAIRSQSQRPKVLVAVSAVGLYGDCGAAEVVESQAPGDDFLAHLCQRWEAAAHEVEALGVRLVQPRIGVVLGHEGGMLGALLPLFMAGLGGTVGSGRQVLPWIHLHDLVELLHLSLEQEAYAGPLNAVAPHPVEQATFTAALAGALGKPARLPVPAFALRLRLGEAAAVALSSCRALPQRAQALGFVHRYPTLDKALAQLLDPKVVQLTSMGPDSPLPLAEAYTRRRRARYLLQARTELAATLPQVFAFFCRAENLGLMTPAAMAMQILGSPPQEVEAGTQIRYRLQIGPLPLRWRTRIAKWESPALFVDAQEQGPYTAWWHEHRFEALADGRTQMQDRVYYALPLGPLGRLAHFFFVRQQLQRIFWYRASAIALRFGAFFDPPPPAG